MSTEVLLQTLQANVQATFGQGRIWYLKSATAPVTIVCESSGNATAPRRFVNVQAGFKFVAAPGDGWSLLRLVSVTAQQIELIIGDDDVDVANAVSVSGNVSTFDLPAVAIATPVPVAIPTGSARAIAGNPARRRITICNPSTSSGNVFVQATGAGAGCGVELQSGQSWELRSAAAFDIRNDSGASVSPSLFEET